MTDIEKRKFLEDLGQHHCTTHYYKYLGIVLTDGVKFLCETAGCWWLADIVASLQFEEKVRKEQFQVYTLTVNPDQSALVKVDDGNGNIVYYQEIEYTDFPLDKIVLWNIDKILILPTEY